MLKVLSFTFNPFRENTYLVVNEAHETIVIDPGMYDKSELTEFYTYIEHHQLKPVKILNTHAHIDHILSVEALKQKYQIPFALHEGELPVLANATYASMMYGIKLAAIPKVDFYLKEGENISFGTSQLKLLLTPGHSPGSISFYAPKEGFVISGDVLFQNSIGRTDLPGGNYEQLIESIQRKMFSLPDKTTVYPGHGPITRIDVEKEYGFLAKCL
ncbi:MAG TPA: MBL fold metallo-hydrolase [Edaphocola sp.]|nr:MBL fold metallo-hydrolase [Edaphocola sp.]